MTEFQPRRSTQALRIGAGLIGAALGFGVAMRLPLIPSTVLSALLVAGGAGLINRLINPERWWGWLGLACGSLLGTANILARSLLDPQGAQGQLEPGLTVLLLAIAGWLAGDRLSRRGLWKPERHPRDLLRSASGLTTGIFAGVVTLTYVTSGLESARTLSSRLSTALTILVFALVAPGWLSHLLRQSRSSSDDA
jgi:hypothetical protein